MDEKILYLINNEWTSPALDFFMVFMSSTSLWLPFLIIAVIALAIFGRFRERALIVSIAFVLAIGDGILTQHIKDAVGRPRPEKTVTGVRMLDFAKARPRILAIGKPLKIKTSNPKGPPERGSSFPSGHTVNNFAVATVFALFYRFGWLAYIPAFCVGYSRIYVGSHWPSDVLISIIIGTGLSLLIVSLLDLLWKKIGPKFVPGIFTNQPNWRSVRQTS